MSSHDVPGDTNLLEHEIKVTTDIPLRQKPYPIPFSHLPMVEKEIKSMLEMGVIEPSSSPYSSPIVLIKKKEMNAQSADPNDRSAQEMFIK